MAKAKAPLSERDANATPAKASGSKRSPKSTAKSDAPEKNPSLYDVANRITKTHGKKRAHEDDDENNAASASSDAEHSKGKNDNDVLPELPPLNTGRVEPDPEDGPYKWNCNQIRSKINALVRSGEVKVGEFQDKIGVTSRSYNDFLKKSGPDAGQFNSTYHGAHKYFLEREKKGIKAPRAKKAKTDKADDTDKYDVSDITLPGEEKEAVPIYDTCDDIRTKINTHLRLPSKTQAGLGRELAKTYAVAGDDTHKISGAQVKSFLEKKGARAGAASAVYYAAYVYFEKLRVKHGKDKTKKRLGMEDAHGREGAPRESDHNSYITVGPNEVPSQDRFGNVTIATVPKGGRARRLPPSRRSIY